MWLCEVGSRLRRTVHRQGSTSKDLSQMERHFVCGVSIGGADVVFVGVHEASRNVVVHHPRLNCRLLFSLIDFCFCVMYRRGLYLVAVGSRCVLCGRGQVVVVITQVL